MPEDSEYDVFAGSVLVAIQVVEDSFGVFATELFVLRGLFGCDIRDKNTLTHSLLDGVDAGT